MTITKKLHKKMAGIFENHFTKCKTTCRLCERGRSYVLELFVNTMQSGSETKLAKCRGKNCSTLISHKNGCLAESFQ